MEYYELSLEAERLRQVELRVTELNTRYGYIEDKIKNIENVTKGINQRTWAILALLAVNAILIALTGLKL